jgi:sec-independent protein translocase protein TatA
MFPFGIGTSEILMIFFVTFIVLGPSKIPEIARMFGKGIRYLREITDDVKNSPEFQEIKNEVYQPLKNFDPKKEMQGFINQSLALDPGNQPSTPLDPHQTQTQTQAQTQAQHDEHKIEIENEEDEQEAIMPRLNPMDRILVEAELKKLNPSPESITKDS